MPHFANTLRRLIKDRLHMNIKEFAERAGLSESKLTKITRPDAHIYVGSEKSYRAIAEALALTPQQLDAAWKEEAAVSTAAPAQKPTTEKSMLHPTITLADIAALPLDQAILFEAAIRTHVKQLRAVQNSARVRPARTAG